MTQMTSSNPQDASRKRPRSRSGSSSTSGASSPKRAASDSPAPTTFSKLVPASQSSTNGSVSTVDREIDEYMKSQGEALSLTDAEAAFIPPSTTDTRLSPKEKLEKIQQLKTRPLRLGDKWYLVSREWYRNWESACGGAPAKGAPDDESQVKAVDNSPIAGSKPGRLKEDMLMEGVDIELLPRDAWNLLVEWYGIPNHTFPRSVVSEGQNPRFRIDFWPVNVFVYVCKPSTPSGPQKWEFSKSDTLKKVEQLAISPILESAGPAARHYRVWKLDNPGDGDDQTGYTPERVMAANPTLIFESQYNNVNENSTLEEVFIEDEDRLILELQPFTIRRSSTMGETSATGAINTAASAQAPLFSGEDFFSTFPSSSSSKATPIVPGASRNTGKSIPNGSTSTSFTMVRTRSQPMKVRGTTGLNNLGNTCFMNSALQCLAHLPELTEYFLYGGYQLELNPDNPLSTGGDLARSYGALLHNLFDPNSLSTVAPRDFKLKISRHAPSFSGYAQHDSQELLAFLLDGLHEDLNRIHKKPYVENPDWEGGGDKELIELARTFWSGYKKRNDSVIVDLFQGQYKSTLVCPECEKVSITFDPFMYLTLPLPVNKNWEHEIYVVTWDTRVHISRNSTFRDLKLLVSKWFNMNPDHLLAVEIFTNRIYKFFQDYSPVGEVADNDHIFIYELPISARQSPNSPKPSPTDPVVLPVYTVSPSFYRGYGNTTFRYTPTRSRECWGYPFFVALDPADASEEEKVVAALVDRYRQTTHRANELYTWQEEEEDDGVMVTAPQSEESSTNGDSMVEVGKDDTTTKDDKDADGDDDMEEVKLPTYREASDETSSAVRLVRGPPKNDLFTLTVMEGNFDPSPANHAGATFDQGRMADMRKRFAECEKDPDTYPTPFRPHDGLVCEWDINFRDYFFGTRGSGPESRWNDTVPHVDAEQAAAAQANSARSRAGISIEDCLDEFVKEEKLGEADPWYCPRCKKHQQATKKFDIWKVPDILVVHLKRFSNSRILRDKIDVLVNFPIEGLDLEGRVEERAAAKRLEEQGVSIDDLGLSDMDEPLLYDLFAVDEHMGGLGGGHYRAYAKNVDDGRWYHFDDSRVDVSSAQASVTPYAYLLFYRRRTNKPIGATALEKIEEAKHAPPPVHVEPVASSSHSVILRPARPDTPPTHQILPFGDASPNSSPDSRTPNLERELHAMNDEPDVFNMRSRSPFAASSQVELDDGTDFPWNGDTTLDTEPTPPSPTVSDDEFGPLPKNQVPIFRLDANRFALDEDYDRDNASLQVEDIVLSNPRGVLVDIVTESHQDDAADHPSDVTNS
ncbi:CSN-associated deubiquitinating enzyme Ubp12 [Tulasnella sp. 403]|nr:CSN-associated deubiquitinating enzyme Ubp12 [Tulasnella sp. 403]